MTRPSSSTRVLCLSAVALACVAMACHRQKVPVRNRPTPGGYFMTVPPNPTPIPIPGRRTHTPVPRR